MKIILKKTGVEPETDKIQAQGFGSSKLFLECSYDNGDISRFAKRENPKNVQSVRIKNALQLIPDGGRVETDFVYSLDKNLLK